jgi:hypothetical protein
MRTLRTFACTVLVIASVFASVCAWFLAQFRETVAFDTSPLAKFGSFDLKDWEVLAGLSFLTFLMACLLAIASSIGLFFAARWGRVALTFAVAVCVLVGAIDWTYAGTPFEIIEVISIAVLGAFSWWLLYRSGVVSQVFDARAN